MHGLPLVLKYWPHTLTSSWYQAPLAVGGVQSGLAATNFDVNFTSISHNDFLEEEDSLATIHNYSHSALIFTKLQLYEESDCQYSFLLNTTIPNKKDLCFYHPPILLSDKNHPHETYERFFSMIWRLGKQTSPCITTPAREYISSEHSVTVGNEGKNEAVEVSSYTNNEWFAFTKAQLACQTWILLLKSGLISFHFSYLVLLVYHFTLKMVKI